MEVVTSLPEHSIVQKPIFGGLCYQPGKHRMKMGACVSEGLELVNDQFAGLITDEVVRRTKAMVRRYEGETCALLVSEWLVQIRNMLSVMASMDLVPGTREAELVFSEFRLRWERTNAVIARSLRGRPLPRLTNADAARLSQIRDLSVRVFGPSVSLNSVPMLLALGRGEG